MWASRKLSLRTRLLWPLLAVSATAAIVVAVLSSVIGRQWAIRDVQEKFDAMEQTIQRASFPLTPAVVSTLAKLSGTELIAVDDSGQVRASTSDLATKTAISPTVETLVSSCGANAEHATTCRAGQQVYLALGIDRSVDRGRTDRASYIIVLFDSTRVQAAGRRAALLPLVTGLSTIVLLTSLMTVMMGRLTGRFARLQRAVEKVADGEFESLVADNSSDEVGRLGQSVDKMALQLKQLWQQVNRQQSQKLLHQIAGGMAHQLRNTLTGARLAVELHRQKCPLSDHQEVDVALREMEGAEGYVRRILLVGAGEQRESESASLRTCLEDVRLSHAAVAKHLRVQLDWNLEPSVDGCEVADGPTLAAAVSNLVLNALQAAQHVLVRAQVLQATACVVTVSDDGPGIEPLVAENLFEPFVTTKPKGVGLGLPLVRRAAEQLVGSVTWWREEDRTIFQFTCAVTKSANGSLEVVDSRSIRS